MVAGSEPSVTLREGREISAVYAIPNQHALATFDRTLIYPSKRKRTTHSRTAIPVQVA